MAIKKHNKYGLKKLTKADIDALKPKCYPVPLFNFGKKIK